MEMLRAANSDEPHRPRKRNRLWAILTILFFVGPAMFGFGTKFYELIRVFQGDPAGAFAVTPIVNYLLASFGFVLLFGWAARNGMFRDIECPKFEMLENERRLDALER
jgi:hypothetical protein